MVISTQIVNKMEPARNPSRMDASGFLRGMERKYVSGDSLGPVCIIQK